MLSNVRTSVRESPPIFKELRRAYGFDEVAIVPGDVTINPEQVDVSFRIGRHEFSLPLLAAAMDAVVDPRFATLLGGLGGLAVLNLEGVHTRYPNPAEVLEEIARTPQEAIIPLLQKVYSAPVREDLIGQVVRCIKRGGGVCAISITPANTKRFAPLAVEAGADMAVVQSTVTTARHISKSPKGLDLAEVCRTLPVPVVVGNCVTYSAALELMETGAAALLVGVGPGAACTTREVLGLGVPQVTATLDCAAARETYLRRTGKYVALITDGGIRNGGDLCKAIASGADAVMLGSIFAQTQEAPGQGYHWGMASPHAALPRGTRVKAGSTGTLRQVLFGPSSVTDGSHNLVGALQTCMGVCGVATIKEMHQVPMVIAPSIKTEGKQLQRNQ
ncbi:MAG: GuaB3 family IMP dehydrogenase-related protein [Chloroflexi bacterium]|nr:GuaB3 family IMP dehydrogenase-related protein [Chloroflexota bacterium]